MKTSTLLLIGGAAAFYYFYKKTPATAAAGTQAVSVASKGTDASPADVAAATDAAQSGANAITPAVIVIQPDDSYDAYWGPGPGWGPSWGSVGARGARGGHGHGHHHGGGGHGHGGHH